MKPRKLLVIKKRGSEKEVIQHVSSRYTSLAHAAEIAARIVEKVRVTG